ncbi:TPA: hypothetical protein I7730_14570 [Vibrio vulnificus]|uniref:Guanylate kinase n=1 Tax=Vibrio vulnificus TaxID=672 RepID=A0A8H9TFL9_VIBVL|nr:hypothetical protein [Vibrio vulnificus]HAS8541012.1 hypothetical protein [Vibrio vulnificus]
MITILAIAGMSGSGKSSVARILTEFYDIPEVTSTTTRSLRAGEVNGVHYHFVNVEGFQSLISDNKLIEYSQHPSTGDFYGMSVDAVKETASKSKMGFVVAVLDPNGVKSAHQFADINPDVTVISFFLESSQETCEKRIRAALTNGECPSRVKARLDRLAGESNWHTAFDYTYRVFNDDEYLKESDLALQILERAS